MHHLRCFSVYVSLCFVFVLIACGEENVTTPDAARIGSDAHNTYDVSSDAGESNRDACCTQDGFSTDTVTATDVVAGDGLPIADANGAADAGADAAASPQLSLVYGNSSGGQLVQSNRYRCRLFVAGAPMSTSQSQHFTARIGIGAATHR